MYIGATRVPLWKPTPISRIFLIPSILIFILIRHHHHRATMVKVQPHKKVVTQSDSRRQASTVAKQSVLPSRDPRTVCMTEGDLDVLKTSFRANRWPERAEKERIAQLIGKYVSPLSSFNFFFIGNLANFCGRSYEKVHHWFSNQRQKLANVEKAMKTPRNPQTPLRSSSNLGVTHMGGTGRAAAKDGKREALPSQAAFVREDSSDRSDISVEDGARILLEFIASAWAAHGTPSP